ncbi:DASH complex subunit Dad1 [Colletotrichum navitas]|uniref:DASH complex subunit DAD1 n=1 Tax=Colletotrichum navitas TaxID=681940 RepID=A0AAD8PN00_9PEZI|nr:DASH complex subunit Dad1 [Colletotrichum navitas]KAK1573068.1 DASH complex subunit Dad1 [Colletotrichum navitas]
MPSREQQRASYHRNPEPGVTIRTFEQRRAELIAEIAASLNQVNANINKLNRSLETTITVGEGFSEAEGLWSNFEDVMVKEPKQNTEGEGKNKGEANSDKAR